MPTFLALPGFLSEFNQLTPAQQQAFRRAVTNFVIDLRTGKIRKGLRVRKMSGHEDVWEMTWANDGRATFEYGEPVREGEQHIIWRRIGTHDIYQRP